MPERESRCVAVMGKHTAAAQISSILKKPIGSDIGVLPAMRETESLGEAESERPLRLMQSA